jgi:hypothetical protein
METTESSRQFRLHKANNRVVGKFQSGCLLKRPKNKPVAMAKLNKPINASTKTMHLLKTSWTYVTISNRSESLSTKKINLSKQLIYHCCNTSKVSIR